MGRVGTRERIDDVEVTSAEIGGDLRTQSVELRFVNRMVDLAPPDAILGAALADDELVVGSATCVFARVDDEGPAVYEDALLATQRVRVELGGRQVSIDRGTRIDAVACEAQSCQSPPRKIGTRSPAVVTPVTSSSGEPIMKSM